jgi:hypothetical protein
MFRVTRNVVARSLGFAIGLAAFVAAHAIEVAMWSAWFGGAHDPWFLNSGRATAFTVTCMFAASLAAGIMRVPGAAIAIGGAAAMTVVLVLGGGSTIFPIVLAAGGLFIAGASLLGAWLGAEIGSLLESKRK